MITQPDATPARVSWRPLRVSFILSSLNLSGGVQAIIEYANRLAARGHTITLVVPDGTVDAAVAASIDGDVRLVKSAVALTAQRGALRNLRLAWSLARVAPASDLVIATHTPTTLSNLFATRLLRRGRGVWLFMDYAQMFAGRRAEGWLLRNALRWQRMAITISRATADELATYGPGHIEMVGLGISNLEQLKPVPMAQRVAEPPTLFHLGDNRPRKGLADFLRAAEIVVAAHHEVRIVIASKEPCTLETSAPITFHLKPDNAQLASLYQSCSVFVSASWAEGLGNPPLEAMACATPVVMTETGGSRDYAVNEGNCLLVPSQQPAQLAQAIVRVLVEPELAAHLSAAGPLTAARFAWPAVMDRLERALLDAAG